MKRINGVWLPDSDRYFKPFFEQDGGFQLDRLERALKFVDSWDIAIDGGAHVGTWSTVMARGFKQIYAIEADEETFECLKRNVFICTNVEPIHAAIGDVNSNFVSMAWDKKHQIQGNTGSKYIVPDMNGRVKMITIDSLNLPSLGFLKLDVEGAEMLALQGALQTIIKHKPVIFVESKKGYASRFGGKDDDCLHFLKEIGATQVERINNDYIFKFL